MDCEQQNVKVSVYCLAYNHEKYIRKTLEGFVSQKTDFPFEVFVHDDASTDGTAAIIREYEEKYPHIIKGIYQTENQYVKRIGIFKTFIWPQISGEYIAVCEGDDYWCDSQKLQLQADILDNHPEVIMACHNTKRITVEDEEVDLMIQEQKEGLLEPEGLIHKNRKNPHTSSLMYRKIIWETERPAFFKNTTGDNSLRLFALTFGDIYYIDRVMSAYRLSVPGSWTERTKNDRQKKIEHTQKTIQFFGEYDRYTNERYRKTIEKVLAQKQYSLAWLQNDYKKAYALSKQVKPPFKQKFYLFLSVYCPFFNRIATKLRNK